MNAIRVSVRPRWWAEYPSPPSDWQYDEADWYSYCRDMEEMDAAYQRAIQKGDEVMPF